MVTSYSSEVAEKLELLTLQQVAERYNIPENSLRYWRAQGTGPKSARIGRRVMYRRVDIDRWVEEQFADGVV
ncbi:hypothetical protein NBCG_01081 [Nocardioidaceae bacterium Broad-1]|nr:hypothetical protein NBCG_01081 [Nocardioidaceae bacterium Broad-1]